MHPVTIKAAKDLKSDGTFVFEHGLPIADRRGTGEPVLAELHFSRRLLQRARDGLRPVLLPGLPVEAHEVVHQVLRFTAIVEVVAVAAETEAIASKALDLIEVEYEVLPAVFDMEEALKPGAPDVRGVGTNKVSCPPEPSTRLSFQKWGDVEEGFKELAHRMIKRASK